MQIKPSDKDIEIQYKTLKEIDFPPQVMVELICGCNLRCVMCPIGNDKITRESGIMEFKLFQKIVDEIALEKNNTKLWTAVMGEPFLLGKRLFEYLQYAQLKNIPVFLNTNAVLIDKTSIEMIHQLGVKQVIVGIDAFTEETYNKIRRGGNFKRVVDNIKYMIEQFKDKETEIILQYIVMDENEDEIEDFKTYWLNEGATIKLRLKQGWGNLVGSALLTKKQEERNMPCPWLMRNLEILWNGNVCQCDGDMDGQYICGNVNEQSIKEIWQGEMKKRREKHYRGQFDFEPCNSCNDWQIPLSKFYYPDDTERSYFVDERK